MRRQLAKSASVLGRAFGGLERLEGRDLLAGDVTVTKNGTTLTILGTNVNDEVVVVGDATPGTFHVFGIDLNASGDTTLINGDTHDFAAGSLDFTGIRYLNVNLRNGNDFFLLTDVADSSAANRLRDVTIDMGAGNDLVAFGSGTQFLVGDIDAAVFTDIQGVEGNVTINGNLTVLTGAGNDQVSDAQMTVDGNFTTLMGAGEDRFTVSQNIVGGNFCANLEGGNGLVSLSRVIVTGNLNIAVPTNASSIASVSWSQVIVGGSMSVSTGCGTAVIQGSSFLVSHNFCLSAGNAPANTVQIRLEAFVVDGSMSVAAGAGASSIQILGGTANSNLCVSAGNTAANVADILIDGVVIGKGTTISTACGNDEVDFYNSTTDTLVITTGSGNDTVDIALGTVIAPGTTNIARCAVIVTGCGDDDVHINGDADGDFFFAIAAFDKLTVATGADDDCVSVGGVLVRVCAVFDGGCGTDNYDDNGSNSFLKKYTRVLFETFDDCDEEEEIPD